VALHVLRRKQFLPLPRAEAFRFFADASNLERITPPWLNFRIVKHPEGGIHTGALIRYRLGWHGIPIGWTTEIRRWNPPYFFTDTQIRGPYKLWHHTHKFEEVEGGTMMTDIVWYKLPFGPLGEIAHAIHVRKDVERIFDYRVQEIAKLIK
jgi:ligand-binding SRPBCC domain-containing protein